MLQRRKRFLNYLSFGKSSDIRIGQCDSANMVILQEMCLNVIQQCMISIDTNITTSQTLKSLRKELSDSLCSYLTCEHYHDDLFTDDGTIVSFIHSFTNQIHLISFRFKSLIKCR